VLAATNRNPEEAVSQGKLREDLLYRLKVFPVHLPPLRERHGDVELLAEHFLERLNAAEGTTKRFTPEALHHLEAHSWPGNVRELKNLVHQAYILADNEITGVNLPQEVGGSAVRTGGGLGIEPGLSLDEADRRLIMATLDHCGGDKRKSAEILGISLKTLYNRLKVYQS
jgi:DNA-binding NtrC family response regulator